MSSERDPKILQALAALQAALAELEAPWMIIGGIAVIARGVPRLTVDIDATVWGKDTSLDDIVAKLASHLIVFRIPDGHAFAEYRQVLLLVHQPTGTRLEVAVGWLPFEREAIERATTTRFGDREILAAQPEDLIVYKFVSWRGRDQQDVENLLLLYHDLIDLDRVRKLVHELAEALGQPQRVEELEELLRKARSQHD